MNTMPDLERRLRALRRPASADPIQKQRLRAELLSRAHRSRERDRFLRGAVLASLVTAVLLTNESAITRYDSFMIERAEGDTTEFRTSGNPTLSIGVSGLDDYERLRFMLKQEEFSLLHMAGKSRLIGISGYAFEDMTFILGRYQAETSLGLHDLAIPLRNDFVGGFSGRHQLFLDQEWGPCLERIFSGRAQAVGDTVVASLQEEITADLYRFDSEEFGAITVMMGRKRSADAGGS